MNWLNRWRQRQIDIAHGADTDLIRDNARRYRRSAALFGVGVLLAWLGEKLPLIHGVKVFLDGLAALCLVAGLILVQWAQSESWFLSQPDREGPPSIVDDKIREEPPEQY